jgi:hypothetical protein
MWRAGEGWVILINVESREGMGEIFTQGRREK